MDKAPPSPIAVSTGFLARKTLESSHNADPDGIDDEFGGPVAGLKKWTRAAGLNPEVSSPHIAELKGGSAPNSMRKPRLSSAPTVARKLVVAAALVVGLLAVVMTSRDGGSAIEQEVSMAGEPATKALCALQASSAVGALIVVALSPNLALLILAHASAHTALLLRGVLGFVEAKHCAAVQQYRRRLVGWSVWLDVRAHLSAVAAVVAWSTSSLALVLYVLVSMGNDNLFPWAWWSSHMVLSGAVLALGSMSSGQHPSQPPLILLLCSMIAGALYAGPFAPSVPWALVVCPVLHLVEACRGLSFACEEERRKPQKSGGYDCHDAVSTDRQLLATLLGNQDTSEFERHLASERRLCELYCFQDLVACESAPAAHELLDRYRKWCAQYTADRAPLAVRRLPALDDPQRVELCPQASVLRAKQALLGMLRAPYARFLARKRRLHLSTGRQEIKPSTPLLGFLNIRGLLSCALARRNEANLTVV